MRSGNASSFPWAKGQRIQGAAGGRLSFPLRWHRTHPVAIWSRHLLGAHGTLDIKGWTTSSQGWRLRGRNRSQPKRPVSASPGAPQAAEPRLSLCLPSPGGASLSSSPRVPPASCWRNSARVAWRPLAPPGGHPATASPQPLAPARRPLTLGGASESRVPARDGRRGGREAPGAGTLHVSRLRGARLKRRLVSDPAQQALVLPAGAVPRAARNPSPPPRAPCARSSGSPSPTGRCPQPPCCRGPSAGTHSTCHASPPARTPPPAHDRAGAPRLLRGDPSPPRSFPAPRAHSRPDPAATRPRRLRVGLQRSGQGG